MGDRFGDMSDEEKEEIKELIEIFRNPYSNNDDMHQLIGLHMDNKTHLENLAYLISQMRRVLAEKDDDLELMDYIKSDIPFDVQIIIEERLVEVLPNTLPNENDFELLMGFVDILSDHTEAAKLITNRASELFPEGLSKEDEISELISLWQKYHHRTHIGILIEEKILGLVSRISNKENLFCLLTTAELGKPRKIIEVRIATILRDVILPNISFYKDVIELYTQTYELPNSIASLVKTRLIEILAGISNIHTLMDAGDLIDPATVVGRPIYSAILDALEKTFDMELLISLDSTSERWKKGLIQDRMTELLENIHVSHIPDWLKDILKKKKKLPEFMTATLQSKIKDFEEAIA